MSKFLANARRWLRSRNPGWLWPNKLTQIEWHDSSQQEELHCSQAEELQRRDKQLLHAQFLQQNSDLREVHDKSQWNGRIEVVSEFHLLHYYKMKSSRGSGYYFGTYWQDTGSAKWNQLYERFKIFSRCWISTEWKDSHVTSRRLSFPLHPIPQGRLCRSLGLPSGRGGPPSIWDTHGISENVLASPVASSSAPYPQELNPWSSGREEPIHSSSGKVWKAKTRSRSERLVWTVSQKFNHPLRGRCLKELWSRATATADRRSSFWQIPYTSYVWLLVGKIQTEVCTCSQLRTLCFGSKKWWWSILWMI